MGPLPLGDRSPVTLKNAIGKAQSLKTAVGLAFPPRQTEVYTKQSKKRTILQLPGGKTYPIGYNKEVPENSKEPRTCKIDKRAYMFINVMFSFEWPKLLRVATNALCL